MTEPEPWVPEGFDEFWYGLVGEAMSAPLDLSRTWVDEGVSDSHVVQLLAFRGAGGSTRQGWIAFPHGARRLAGFLCIPPYGRWSMQPNEHGTRAGHVSMSFNFFGEGPFHHEPYSVERGYFAEGAESPDTWVFGRMFQDCVIALRLLQAQVEVDEHRLGATGLSQGGGMALWLGAFCPLVRSVVADMPFIAGVPWVLQRNVHRYPIKELIDFMDSLPLGREQVMNTLSFFDTLNVATRVEVPTRLTYGTRDPSVHAPQVLAIHKVVSAPKEIEELDSGHDWHPRMVEGTLSWFRRTL